jgi:hypothetical protein
MKSIPNHAPTSVASLDCRDIDAGNASHIYGIQYGGPAEVCRIQFQHGARGMESSTAGVFDDDLLAIVQDRLEGFQDGPFSCEENAKALCLVREAREALALRVARRMVKGVLGVTKPH